LRYKLKNGIAIHVPKGKTNAAARHHLPAVTSVSSNGIQDLIEFDGLRVSKDGILRLSLLFPGARLVKLNRGRPKELRNILPRVLSRVVSCTNINCVTLQPKEPTRPTFEVLEVDPPVLRCNYCGRYLDPDAVSAQLITGLWPETKP
jgi:aspartate carbamoyltransferase regulatory subunit